MADVADFIKVLLASFVTLFPVVNPVGCAPIFLALTDQYPAAAQRLLSKKVGAYGFFLLAGSCLFGTPVLGFFGISLFIVQIAGGLVVAAAGWGLLNQKEEDTSAKNVAITVDDALSHAFYPLTLPITVGPGCISIAITIGAHLRRQDGSGWLHGVPRHFVAALSGMFLLCLLVVFCYSHAGRLVMALGKSGTTILMRLSAFILLAIGVQIFWNGLASGIPEILRAVSAVSGAVK